MAPIKLDLIDLPEIIFKKIKNQVKYCALIGITNITKRVLRMNYITMVSQNYVYSINTLRPRQMIQQGNAH